MVDTDSYRQKPLTVNRVWHAYMQYDPISWQCRQWKVTKTMVEIFIVWELDFCNGRGHIFDILVFH